MKQDWQNCLHLSLACLLSVAIMVAPRAASAESAPDELPVRRAWGYLYGGGAIVSHVEMSVETFPRKSHYPLHSIVRVYAQRLRSQWSHTMIDAAVEIVGDDEDRAYDRFIGAALGLASRDCRTVQDRVQTLARDGNQRLVERALPYMAVDAARNLLEDSLETTTTGEEPSFKLSLGEQEQLLWVGDVETIRVYRDFMEHNAKIAPPRVAEQRRADRMLRALRARVDLTDEQRERHAWAATVLADIAADPMHVYGRGIFSRALFAARFHDPLLTDEVLLKFVDGTFPYASAAQVDGAIALLGARRVEGAVKHLEQLRDTRGEYRDTLIEQAIGYIRTEKKGEEWGSGVDSQGEEEGPGVDKATERGRSQ